MKRHLIIRADADSHIGSGHLMRCLALAQTWQDTGGSVVFLSHCESEALIQRVTDEGFRFIPVETPHPDPADHKIALKVLSSLNPQASGRDLWFVCDGYHFSPEYHKAIRESGYKLLVMDDYNHLAVYHADCLLNQNIHASSLRYSCDPDTTQLVGSKYILLRREFLQYQNPKRRIPNKSRNVLLTMGGADPDNVTSKVIRALNLLNDNDLEVKIVVGPANPHMETLKKELPSSVFSGTLCPSVDDMPGLMAWSDMAITAAGSTCWELAYMGVPSMTITISEDQVGVAEGLDQAAIAQHIGWYTDLTSEQIAGKLDQLINDKAKRSRFSRSGMDLVNGKGAREVVRSMIIGELHLRPVAEKDCELLFDWANDPTVRQNAFQPEPIEWEDHHKWFTSKRDSTHCFQYIATSIDGIPVGQIRFDLGEKYAEVDYSLDPQFRGLGLGTSLLEEGIGQLASVIAGPLIIQGKVKQKNFQSMMSFESAGFNVTEKRKGFIRYTRNIDAKPHMRQMTKNRCVPVGRK